VSNAIPVPKPGLQASCSAREKTSPGRLVLMSVRTTTDESPETILKRRYARGEIDRDEFERRLNDLRR
jgi:hypothetical protein